MPHQKILLWLSGLIALAVAGCFICIAFCMRPAGDDLALLALLREKGFAGSVAHNFAFFNFRHIPLLLFNSLFSLAAIEKAYVLAVPLFYLFLLGVLLFSCTVIFKKLSLPVFKGRLLRIVYALFFTGTLYFNTFQAIEVWTYLTDILYYLTPVVFSVAGLAVLIDSSFKNALFKNVLLITCSCVAGSGVENYSLGLLLFLTCFIGSRYKPGNAFLQNSMNRKLLLIFFSVLISALIVYLAPGTGNRPAIESQFFSSGHTSLLFSFGNLFLQKKMAVVLLFLTSWMPAGSNLNEMHERILKKIMAWSCFLSLVFLAITLFISQRVFHGDIPARSWFAFNFTSAIFFIALFVYLKNRLSQAAGSVLVYAGSSVLLLILLSYCFLHIPQLAYYAKSYDRRVTQMKQFKHTAPVLLLEPLSEPGILLSNELSADTSATANKMTQGAYGLDFAIALKQ